MGKIITTTIKVSDKPTSKAIKEVDEAYRHPITFDDDCPELTYDEMVEMVKQTEEMYNF